MEVQHFMSYEDLLAAAFEFYGSCLGTEECRFEVIQSLMSEYDIDADLAEEVADHAYNEWIEVYE